MSNRQNFNRQTRLAIIQRASVSGVPTCERIEAGARCSCTKGLEVNHVRMDALVPDDVKRAKTLTAEDGELICKAHHLIETRQQVADLAKAVRVEAAHLGAKPPPEKPLVSKGFAKVSMRDKQPPLRIAAGQPAWARRFPGAFE